MTNWHECMRCERHVHRLRPYCPSWSSKVQVLLLKSAAPRAVQAAQFPDPDFVDAAHELAHRVGLPSSAVMVDYLVACGTGQQVTPDSVATCSRRFCNQPRPRVVVVIGAQTRALVEQSGIVQGRVWEPYGSDWQADVVFTNDLGDDVIQTLGDLLNLQPSAGRVVSRAAASAQAASLYALIGDHEGHRRKKVGERAWQTRRTHHLPLRIIEKHLEGSLFASVFHPSGFWNFVVVDCDRHNALQSRVFDETAARIHKAFPDSIPVRSSDSGGIHQYIAVPKETTYEEAALVVRLFLAQQSLLWLESDGSNPVRSLRIEVPEDPPRLPFGLGSTLLGDTRPIATQIQDFCQRLQRASTKDFEAAREQIFKDMKFHGSWNSVKARRIRERLDELEVKHLPSPTFETGNPLATIAHDLPLSLQKVAAYGIPAYATRTRWVKALVDALGNLMAPDAVADIIEMWLRSSRLSRPQSDSSPVAKNTTPRTRLHVSSDIENDLEAVVEQARKAAMARSRRTGVPKRIWRQIDMLTRSIHAQMINPIARQAIEAQRKRAFHNADSITLEMLRRSAFHILRLFCQGNRKYRKPVRRRCVGWREFAKFATKDRMHDIELALTHITSDGRGWLAFKQAEAPGRSRQYELRDMAWPIRPYEPLVYKP